jgi:hypothetical protein
MPDIQLERTHDGTRETAQNQDATERAVNRAVPAWLRSSVLIEAEDIVAGGTNKIAHKLGRKLRGWFLADNVAAAANRVWRVSGETDTATHITLDCDVNCTISLVVF